MSRGDIERLRVPPFSAWFLGLVCGGYAAFMTVLFLAAGGLAPAPVIEALGLNDPELVAAAEEPSGFWDAVGASAVVLSVPAAVLTAWRVSRSGVDVSERDVRVRGFWRDRVLARASIVGVVRQEWWWPSILFIDRHGASRRTPVWALAAGERTVDVVWRHQERNMNRLVALLGEAPLP